MSAEMSSVIILPEPASKFNGCPWRQFSCHIFLCTILVFIVICISTDLGDFPNATASKLEEEPVLMYLGSTFARGEFAVEENFEDVVVAEAIPGSFADVTFNTSTYRDNRGYRCAHSLRYGGLNGDAEHRSKRVVGQDPNGTAVPSDLGFTSYFVDSIGGGDEDNLLHHIGGAPIGVEAVPTGGQAFALRASAAGQPLFSGYLIVCSKPVVVSTEAAVASARIYLAQAGWHEATDELRAWADIGDPAGGISLLPNCSSVATRENVDILGLRTATPGAAFTGAPLTHGDPALLPDTWQWLDLSASLGRLDHAEVSVCVGLQTAAGAEAVYIDRLRVSGADESSAAGAGEESAAAPSCSPSPVLVGTASLSSLAVDGSCGRGGEWPLVAIGVLAALTSIGWLVRKFAATA